MATTPIAPFFSSTTTAVVSSSFLYHCCGCLIVSPPPSTRLSPRLSSTIAAVVSSYLLHHGRGCLLVSPPPTTLLSPLSFVNDADFFALLRQLCRFLLRQQSRSILLSPSPTPEEEFKKFADSQDVHTNICTKIAPSIFGQEDVKRAEACLLFGGSRKSMPDGVKQRGDINVLLLGDPATAKSQREFYLEGGAMVLAVGGVVYR